MSSGCCCVKITAEMGEEGKEQNLIPVGIYTGWSVGKYYTVLPKKWNMPEMERQHNQDMVTIKVNIDGLCNQVMWV